MADGTRNGIVAAAFVGSALLGGGNSVGVRFSNRELDPLWGAGLRFGLASVLLFVLLRALGHRVPTGEALQGAVRFGLLQFGVSFALIYWGLVEVQAGMGQVLLSLVPLATLLLAVAQGQERLTTRSIVGSLLSLAGIAVVVAGNFSGSAPVLRLGALLLAVLAFAQSGITLRRHPPVHPLAANAIGMGAGALTLLAGSFLLGESHALPRLTATWLALAYVVVVGSIVVFSLGVYVIQQWSAARGSYIMVLVPVSTFFLSSALDGERLGTGLLLGSALVLGGVWLGALRQPDKPATAS